MESFLNYLLTKINNDFNNRKDNFLRDNIEKSLGKLGFYFPSESELIIFAERRITKVIDSDFKLDLYYLDYIDEENNGILLGSINYDFNYESSGSLITSEIRYSFL